MKVIIDLIEDIRTAINNDSDFSLSVMGLTENSDGEFTPSWQSDVCQYRLSETDKKIYFLLGRENPLNIGSLLEELNALSNEAMMYEVCVSYSKENHRIDSSLIGFGEALQDKKYLLFIADQ
jgi:hypothetical protein